MVMGQASTSKTKKSEDKTYLWEVRGQFEFSPDGKLLNMIKTMLYVSAYSASDAARKAIERMGANATVYRTAQMFEDNGEDNE